MTTNEDIFFRKRIVKTSFTIVNGLKVTNLFKIPTNLKIGLKILIFVLNIKK